MKFFNCTLEKVEKMCNSIMYVFEPRSYLDVPDDIVQFVEQELKPFGIMKCDYGITEDQLKDVKRDGLINYVKGTLRTRILNYMSQKDEYQKKGVTIPDDPRFSRALRFEKEIYQLLKMSKPVEQELSFLSDEERKGIGIDDKYIEFLADQDVFNVTKDSVVVEDAAVAEARKQKKGSPKSFADLEA